MLTVSDPEYIRQVNLKVIPATYRQGRRELRIVLQNIGTARIDIKAGWVVASAWLSATARMHLDYHLPGEKCRQYHAPNTEDDWETCSEESTKTPTKLSVNLDRPQEQEAVEPPSTPSAPPSYEEATSDNEAVVKDKTDDIWAGQGEGGKPWDVSQIHNRSPVSDYNHKEWEEIQKRAEENVKNITEDVTSDVPEGRIPTVAEYEAMVTRELQESIEGYVASHNADNSQAIDDTAVASTEMVGEAELVSKLTKAVKEHDEGAAVDVIFNLDVGTMRFLMSSVEHALTKKTVVEDREDTDKSSVSSWEPASKPKLDVGEMPKVENCLCYCRSCKGQWRLPHYCHREQRSCSPMNDGGNGNRPNETSTSESSGSYSNLRDINGGYTVPDKCDCWCNYCTHARHYRPHYCSRHMQECTEKKKVQREDEEMDTQEDEEVNNLYPTLEGESTSSEEDGAKECRCYCSSCKKAMQLFPHPCPYGHKPRAHNSFQPWKWMAIRRQIRFLESSARNLRLGLDGMRSKKAKKENPKKSD